MSFEIELKDIGGASQYLDGLKAKLANLAPVYNEIGTALVEETRTGFATSTDPYGTPWLPLKMRAGQPLRDTARLMNSITHVADNEGVEVGTNVAYAATHQFGATITPKVAPWLVFQGPSGTVFTKQVTVPARPFLPTPEKGIPASWAQTIFDAIRARLGVAK